jgi:ethanolamine ammonia-lyase large subunit
MANRLRAGLVICGKLQRADSAVVLHTNHAEADQDDMDAVALLVAVG